MEHPRFILGRIGAVCIITLLGVGCSHLQTATQTKQPLEVSDLVARQFAFDGKAVRIRGFLVRVAGGVQLLDARFSACYASEEGHEFVTTTLPESALGQKVNGAWYGQQEGRLAIVSGIFRANADPWPKATVIENPSNRAVGPITHARIEVLESSHCDLSLEKTPH